MRGWSGGECAQSNERGGGGGVGDRWERERSRDLRDVSDVWGRHVDNTVGVGRFIMMIPGSRRVEERVEYRSWCDACMRSRKGEYGGRIKRLAPSCAARVRVTVAAGKWLFVKKRGSLARYWGLLCRSAHFDDLLSDRTITMLRSDSLKLLGTLVHCDPESYDRSTTPLL